MKLSVVLMAAAAAVVVASGTADAVLVAGAGPGTGTAQIAHQLTGKGANTAPLAAPIFQVPGDYAPNAGIGGAGGGFQSPGDTYPVLGGVIGQNQNPFGLVANVPVTQTTAPGALGAGWNGATSTIVGVAGGGRAGIAITAATVSNVGVATESLNTIGASTDYINIGAFPILNVKYGHFISQQASVGGGGFAAAAVRSRIQIDPAGGVGPAFNPAITIQPADLVFAFDGVGVGRNDFFTGADVGRSIVNAAGNAATFAGIATTPFFNIPAGASIRLSGAYTLIGDPADLTLLALPPSLTTDDFTLGYGGSTDSQSVLTPEPSSLVLLVATAVLLRRRSEA